MFLASKNSSLVFETFSLSKKYFSRLIIYDEDLFRRRPRESTARGKVRGRCARMAEFLGIWPSGHVQLTKVRLSDGCGGKTNTTAAQFAFDRYGFEGYLGNAGL